ncbi:succinate dehydrogenase hydrophobic membrane anchor subunit [Microbacterium caowuchunii]|jgi:succinate dehydrogenase / fumarate reductase, membrane anchor subunit|nr:succinate dehydrogenase hydrophobic membrane anchor subunit [Microbacterium caowuchunii]
MSTTIAAPRTPHSAPRRKGPNLEKWGWMYMRVSGVLLVVLIFGHLFVNLLTGDGIHQIDFAFVAGKLASPFWQWWDFLMLTLAMIHGANGMRTIVNDYVTHGGTRRTLVWAIWIVSVFLIVLGTLVVFTFDPCLGVTPDSVLWDRCQ